MPEAIRARSAVSISESMEPQPPLRGAPSRRASAAGGVFSRLSSSRRAPPDPAQAFDAAPQAQITVPRQPYAQDAKQLLTRLCRPGSIEMSHILTLARDEVLRRDARFHCSDFAHEQPHLASLWDYEPTDAERDAIKAMPTATRRKLRKLITDDLVGLFKRAPVQLDMPTGSGDTVAYEQRFGHITHTTQKDGTEVYGLERDTTLSSVAIKRDSERANGHMLQYGANGASVVAGKHLVVWRSARSDTPSKLQEKLLGACCAALEAAGGDPAQTTGMHRVDTATGPEWEFRPCLISAMDANWLKGMASCLTGEANEAACLRGLTHACDHLFATPQSYTVRVGDTLVPVRLRKPEILHVVLSSQAATVSNLVQARRFNRGGALSLLHSLAARWQDQPDGVGRLAGLLGAARSTLAAQEALEAAARSPDYADLSARQKLALDWLLLTFCNHDRAGRMLLDDADPGKEMLLLTHLMAETGQAVGVECKSGVDRTLTLTALFAAAHHMSVSQPDAVMTPQNPGAAHGKTLASLFTTFANAFGEPVVRLVRGVRGGIKWAKSMVPRTYYLPDLDESAPLGMLRFHRKIERPRLTMELLQIWGTSPTTPLQRADLRDDYWRTLHDVDLLNGLSEVAAEVLQSSAWQRLRGTNDAPVPPASLVDEPLHDCIGQMLAQLFDHQVGVGSPARSPALRQRAFVQAYRRLLVLQNKAPQGAWNDATQTLIDSLSMHLHTQTRTQAVASDLVLALKEQQPAPAPELVGAALSATQRRLTAVQRQLTPQASLRHRLRRFLRAWFSPQTYKDLPQPQFTTAYQSADGAQRSALCVRLAAADSGRITPEVSAYARQLSANTPHLLLQHGSDATAQQTLQRSIEADASLANKLLAVGLPADGDLYKQSGSYGTNVPFAALRQRLVAAMMGNRDGFALPQALRTPELEALLLTRLDEARASLKLPSDAPLTPNQRQALVFHCIHHTLPHCLLEQTGAASYSCGGRDLDAATASAAYLFAVDHRPAEPAAWQGFVRTLEGLVFAPMVLLKDRLLAERSLARLQSCLMLFEM